MRRMKKATKLLALSMVLALTAGSVSVSAAALPDISVEENVDEPAAETPKATEPEDSAASSDQEKDQADKKQPADNAASDDKSSSEDEQKSKEDTSGKEESFSEEPEAQIDDTADINDENAATASDPDITTESSGQKNIDPALGLNQTDASTTGLSTGGIAGIVIAVLAVAAIALLIGSGVLFKKKD